MGYSSTHGHSHRCSNCGRIYYDSDGECGCEEENEELEIPALSRIAEKPTLETHCMIPVTFYYVSQGPIDDSARYKTPEEAIDGWRKIVELLEVK